MQEIVVVAYTEHLYAVVHVYRFYSLSFFQSSLDFLKIRTVKYRLLT